MKYLIRFDRNTNKEKWDYRWLIFSNRKIAEAEVERMETCKEYFGNIEIEEVKEG